MLRIIAGEYRSRQLLAPPDAEVSRPYAHRVKESVFNRLRGWFEAAHVLDLFAGVGTVGLETLSRGAASAVMVELDRRIFELLERNIDTLGCADRAKAIHGDALSPGVLLRVPEPVDLVFVDPPYTLLREAGSRERVLAQLARCADVMTPNGLLVLRSPVGPEDTDLTVAGLAGPEAHAYGGGTWVLLYQPAAASEGEADG